MGMQILRVRCQPGFDVFCFLVCLPTLSYRVFVKHTSLQLLPVPGHLVCKRYEIFLSLRVTQNDAGETERRQNGDKEAECEIKMQSCKCHVQTQTPVSQCYFHPPPLQKSKQYVMCPLLFSVTRCTKIHTVAKMITK